MPGPGWYPDPQDSASVRWFDGENWSEYRQAADVRTGPAIDAAATSAADPTATIGPAAGPGGAAFGYDPYAATASYGPVADTAPGAPGGVSTEVRADTAPAPAPATAGPAPAATRSHAAAGRAKLDRRVVLIVAIVAVVVIGLVVGAIMLFTGGQKSFTYQGKPVKNANATLKQAETNLNHVVANRNGIAGGSARCYFAVPTHPVAGAKSSDVQSNLSCGPVLFIDGDPSREYLSFALTSNAAGGSVTLTPAAQPTSPNPGAEPANVTLERPDGAKPPAGNGGLTSPTPPAAAAGSLNVGTVTQPSGTKPVKAIIGSYSGGITITEIGRVSRFGTGDSAHSAPANQHLYAFELGPAAGNSGTVKDLSGDTTITIDSGKARGLPTPASGQAIIAAVPDSAKSVVLTLTDSGLKQSFSLLTEKPDPNNIQVLARGNRSISPNQTMAATYNYSTKVVFADHQTGQTQTATIKLATATLAYRDDTNNFTASGTDKALLIPDVVYTGSHDGGPYGVDTSLLTFTPAGQAAIPAKNISSDPTKIRNVFEVPADVTSGTITVGGTANETFSGSASTYTVSVATPVSFQIDFPAG
jgi:hypothetical protein